MFSPLTARANFCAAVKRTLGVSPDARQLDGSFHDIKVKGGPKAWFVYLEEFDRARGHFGDWRTGDQFNWFSDHKGTSRMTDAEYVSMRAALAEHRRQEDANKIRILEDVERIYHHTRPASPNHPYLQRKHIQPHDGVHFYPSTGKRVIHDEPVNGSLLVPVFNDDEELQGLQFITAAGIKRNWGPTSGGHFWVGKPSRREAAVAEGFATAATVKESDGWPCCVAFGASGLMHVGQYVRERFDPECLVIIADGDDAGRKAAHAAARATDALVYEAADGLDYNDERNEGLA